MLQHKKHAQTTIKIFTTILTLLLITGLFSNVSAQVTVIDEVKYTTSMGGFPTSGTTVAYGHGFRGNGYVVTEAQFYVSRGSANSSAVVTAKIYASSGTFGVSDLPSGAALATSDAIAFNSIPSGLGWQTFLFTGANQFQTVAGTNYLIVISVSDNAALYVYFSSEASSNNGGRSLQNVPTSGTPWNTPTSGYYMFFKVLGSSAPSVPTWAVSYDANFPSGVSGTGNVPIDNNEYAVDDVVNVAVNIGNLAASGYHFQGWAFINNTDVPDFEVSDTGVIPDNFLMPNNDVVLYAVWVEDLTSPTPTPKSTDPAETNLDAIQYVLLFAAAVFFTAISIYRKTLLPTALATVLWFTLALINYLLNTSTISASISLIYLLLGLVFAGKVINDIFYNYASHKAAQWRVDAI